MTPRMLLAALALSAVALPASAASWQWPQPVNVGQELIARDPSFEPSGAVWLSGRGSLVLVGDEGQVAEVTADGAVQNEWNLGRQFDLEDVTVIDSSSSIVYLGDENTSSALEFDLAEGRLTGRAWSFASKLSEVDGAAGMEGLTFVPDGFHPFGETISGGVFYAGWQYDGDIYVFAPNLDVSGAQTFVEEIHMTSGYTDLAALSFNKNTGLTYALYDGLNILEERDAHGLLVNTYQVPGNDQEGIAIVDNYPDATATVFIAEDTFHVYSYAGYPVAYPIITPVPEPTPEPTPAPAPEPTPAPAPAPIDADNDGSPVDTDCNDADASIATPQTYYADLDHDGLGAGSSALLCSATAPEGYSVNVLDTDDSIPNAGIEIYGDGRDNDGDGAVDENNTLAENGAHPSFGALTPTQGSGFGTDILSAVGIDNGAVLVEYRDHARYRYSIYAIRTRALTKVSSLDTSAYLIVALGRQTALVNGYNGEIVASTRAFKHDYVARAWARSVLGW